MLFNLISIPFEKVDGKGLSLNDLVFSEGKAGKKSAADQIYLWVTNDYEKYYHASDGWKTMGTDATPFDKNYPNGVPAGTALWYKPAKRAAAGTATCSGAINPDAHTTITINRGKMNFVAMPYPVNLKLDDSNQIDWGGAGKGKKSAADQVYIWVDNDYEKYYLSSDGWKSMDVDGAMFAAKHPDGIAVGEGFWLVTKTKTGSETYDITFYSPVNSDKE